MDANRVGSIDFWRGAVLIAILVDHIPGNMLEFCDAAELRAFGQFRGFRLSVRAFGQDWSICQERESLARRRSRADASSVR